MTAANTRTIPEPFARAVATVRRLLSEAGLNLVGEFNFSDRSYLQPRVGARSCIVLLVDTPMLLVEAIALDRAAAVFLPLHVVVSGDHKISYIHWASPMASWGLRPPAPAKHALECLCARVSTSLSALPQFSEEVALQQQG